MNPTQEKIKTFVDEYKELFSQEYNIFCLSMVDKRSVQKDEYGSTGLDGFIGKFAYEIPEKLHNIIHDALNKEEWEWFVSKKGTDWFARTFKEFSPADRI